MKNFLLISAAFLCSFQSFSQITLGTADFPRPGDVDTISSATAFSGMDYQSTGANYTWDFSALEPTTTSQRIDSFKTVASVGGLFGLYFGLLNPSSVVLPRQNITIGPLMLTSVNSFYNNTSAGYSQTGFGAAVGGLPTTITLPINTVPFAYKPVDMIYKFPLAFGNRDSCFPVDTLGVPGLLYYKGSLKRVNEVDGWGTITTPYGTFDCLRVKSILNEHDTIYVDTLGFGFGFDYPERVEYKWLGKKFGQPLLQVVTLFGIVSEITYFGYPVCKLAAAYNIPQDTIYEGTSLSFTNGTNLSGTYNWKINGLTFSNSQNASYAFLTPGTYTVTLVSTAGKCVDSTSRVITVLYSNCNLVTLINANHESVTQGDIVNFSGGSNAPVSYAWSLNGVPFSNTKDTSYKFDLAPGTYSVTLVTSHLNCSDSSSKIITVTAVPPNPPGPPSPPITDFHVDLYPNPASQYVTLSVLLPSESDIRVEMIGPLGQLLLANEWKSLSSGAHNLFLSIPPSTKASAGYFLKIDWKWGTVIKKFVVSKGDKQ